MRWLSTAPSPTPPTSSPKRSLVRRPCPSGSCHSSGRGQSWSQEKPSVIRFDIASRQQAWDAQTNTFEAFDQPGRVADVYVFCLHTPDKATNDNVADPSMWTFWVIATATLDTELDDQKTIGTGRLSTLANPVSWDDLHDAVDQTIS